MKLVDHGHTDDDRAKGPSEASLRAAFEQVMQREHPDGPAPGRRTRYFRFGVSMLVLAVFTAVAGGYPLPSDGGWRVMFLMFAVALAFIAAYYIDRSMRDTIPSRRADVAPASTKKARPRRVK